MIRIRAMLRETSNITIVKIEVPMAAFSPVAFTASSRAVKKKDISTSMG